MARRRSNTEAYERIDLSDFDNDIRQEILTDIAAGGEEFGITVVEEFVNGAARVPVYGTYDKEATNEALAKLKTELKETDDDALIDNAEATAATKAAEARKAEEEELLRITKENPDAETGLATTGGEPAPNKFTTGKEKDAVVENNAADATKTPQPVQSKLKK